MSNLTNGKSKDVALVLASGGAKGYAHIGAIEALQARGYNIKSVTGCSMGSLVGGMFAAGKLQETKELMLSVDFYKYFRLLDLGFSKDGLLKGDKVMNLLREIAPGSQIETLPTPFRAVSTDITHGREVLFDHGDLFDAIRASISIPGVFKPMRIDGAEFIDGGVMDPIPLQFAPRAEGDILVAVDINAHPDPAYDNHSTSLAQRADTLLDTLEQKSDTIPQIANNPWARDMLTKVRGKAKEMASEAAVSANKAKSAVTHVLAQYTNLSLVALTDMALRITPPDIHVAIPINRFSTFDFANAAEIIEDGRQRMNAALDDYEKA